MPPARERWLWRAAAAGSGAALLLLSLATLEESRLARPGLWLTIVDANGRPALERAWPNADLAALAAIRGLPPLPYEARLSGVWYVPRAGRHGFTVRSDAEASVRIGGRDVLARVRVRQRGGRGQLDLPAGPVQIELRLRAADQTPLLRLIHSEPGGRPRPLDPDALYARAADLDQRAARLRAGALRTAGAVCVLLTLLLLVAQAFSGRLARGVWPGWWTRLALPAAIVVLAGLLRWDALVSRQWAQDAPPWASRLAATVESLWPGGPPLGRERSAGLVGEPRGASPDESLAPHLASTLLSTLTVLAAFGLALELSPRSLALAASALLAVDRQAILAATAMPAGPAAVLLATALGAALLHLERRRPAWVAGGLRSRSLLALALLLVAGAAWRAIDIPAHPASLFESVRTGRPASETAALVVALLAELVRAAGRGLAFLGRPLPGLLWLLSGLGLLLWATTRRGRLTVLLLFASLVPYFLVGEPDRAGTLTRQVDPFLLAAAAYVLARGGEWARRRHAREAPAPAEAPAPQRPLPGWGKKIAFAAAMVAFTLVACGVLATGFFYVRAKRVRFPRTELRSQGDWPVARDDEIGFVAAKNASTIWRLSRSGLTAHIYTDGRGARVNAPGEWTPDQVDLLTVGCSFSWGHAIENQDTYTERLRRKLGIRVANFAMGSYGTLHSLLTLRRNLDLRPRLVVYGFIRKHVSRNLSPCAPSIAPFCAPQAYVALDRDGNPQIRPPRFEYFTPELNRKFMEEVATTERFNFHDVLWRARVDYFRLRNYGALSAPDDAETGEKSLTWLLGQMADATRDAGARLLVVYIPRLVPGRVLPPPHELLKAVEAHRLDLLSLEAAAARRLEGAADLDLSLEDGHPNAAGHGFIADELERAIRDRHLLDALPETVARAIPPSGR